MGLSNVWGGTDQDTEKCELFTLNSASITADGQDGCSYIQSRKWDKVVNCCALYWVEAESHVHIRFVSCTDYPELCDLIRRCCNCILGNLYSLWVSLCNAPSIFKFGCHWLFTWSTCTVTVTPMHAWLHRTRYWSHANMSCLVVSVT